MGLRKKTPNTSTKIQTAVLKCYPIYVNPALRQNKVRQNIKTKIIFMSGVEHVRSCCV